MTLLRKGLRSRSDTSRFRLRFGVEIGRLSQRFDDCLVPEMYVYAHGELSIGRLIDADFDEFVQRFDRIIRFNRDVGPACTRRQFTRSSVDKYRANLNDVV